MEEFSPNFLFKVLVVGSLGGLVLALSIVVAVVTLQEYSLVALLRRIESLAKSVL